VLNHSYTDKNVRLAARVQVSYRTEIEPALRLLEEVALRHARVLRDPPPVAHVVTLADSGIELELGFWIRDPESGTQNLRSDVYVSLLAEFRARGIEIPFPQRDVRVLQGTSAAQR
jgi:small-conductance mechanosensitive channel